MFRCGISKVLTLTKHLLHPILLSGPHSLLHRCQHLILFIGTFAFLHIGTCFVWEVWDLVTKLNFTCYTEVTEKLYYLFVKMSSHSPPHCLHPHFNPLWLTWDRNSIHLRIGVQVTDITKSGPPSWTVHLLATTSLFPVILFT